MGRRGVRKGHLFFLIPGVAEGFCGVSKKEQEAFHLLQKSYCSARYDADFLVNYAHVELVQKNLAELMQQLSYSFI
ncbi:hypothetical protein ACLOAU_01720 [Niabella sp. CJ426]|uniref:hypothetical protein n=1 Tax=Niabella sp. CJ426 TaxID=3393740 RepID=UPI003D046144